MIYPLITDKTISTDGRIEHTVSIYKKGEVFPRKILYFGYNSNDQKEISLRSISAGFDWINNNT